MHMQCFFPFGRQEGSRREYPVKGKKSSQREKTEEKMGRSIPHDWTIGSTVELVDQVRLHGMKAKEKEIHYQHSLTYA